MRENSKRILSYFAAAAFVLTLGFSYFGTHFFSFGEPMPVALKQYGTFCGIPLAILLYASPRKALICVAIMAVAITKTILDHHDIPTRSDDRTHFHRYVGDYPVTNFYVRNEGFQGYSGSFRFDATEEVKEKIIEDLSFSREHPQSMHMMKAPYYWWNVEELNAPAYYQTFDGRTFLYFATSKTEATCYLRIHSD